jgi:hypothetical protein
MHFGNPKFNILKFQKNYKISFKLWFYSNNPMVGTMKSLRQVENSILNNFGKYQCVFFPLYLDLLGISLYQ